MVVLITDSKRIQLLKMRSKVLMRLPLTIIATDALHSPQHLFEMEVELFFEEQPVCAGGTHLDQRRSEARYLRHASDKMLRSHSVRGMGVKKFHFFSNWLFGHGRSILQRISDRNWRWMRLSLIRHLSGVRTLLARNSANLKIYFGERYGF